MWAQELHLQPARGLSVFSPLSLKTHDWNKAPDYNGRIVTQSQLTGSYGTFGGGERDTKGESQ